MKKVNPPKKEKKVVDLIANACPEALILKDLITKNNFVVNHIYSGSSTPILQDVDYFVVGSGKIRNSYCISIEPMKTKSLFTADK